MERVKRKRDGLHLSIDHQVKQLFPKEKNWTEFVEDVVKFRFGGAERQKEDLKVEIQKARDEMAELNTKIQLWTRKIEDIEMDEERVKIAEQEAETNRYYSRYVLLKEILAGPVISKQKVIMLAYGVRVTGEILSWATMVRRKFFANGLGEEILNKNPEPLLNYLKEHYIEAYPGISYVGNGEREKEKRQEFLDVTSETKKLCSFGHLYDSLKDRCPECSRWYKEIRSKGYEVDYKTENIPTIFLRFEKGEFRDYFSDLMVAETFKKLEGKIELTGAQGQRAIGPGNGGATQ
jgi:hypothetical protein